MRKTTVKQTHTLFISLLFLLVFVYKTWATAPILKHPLQDSAVCQTLPYFQWTDAVKHPYPGHYEIEISGGQNLVVTDKVPALISHYCPHTEFPAGQIYVWRVRHIALDGLAGQWSEGARFQIRRPTAASLSTAAARDTCRSKPPHDSANKRRTPHKRR